MAKETLEKIKKAEETARQTVLQAEEKAKILLEEAVREGEASLIENEKITKENCQMIFDELKRITDERQKKELDAYQAEIRAKTDEAHLRLLVAQKEILRRFESLCR